MTSNDVTQSDLNENAETIELHGNTVTFLRAGEGPPLLLLHGIAGSYETWAPLIPSLSRDFTVIAPDMLGHGRSAKPRGDYSLGAYAAGARDILLALGHESATVVGHSLGGGVAMQFAYQFPQMVERLILVGAGGVTKDVNIALRLASIPGGSEALSLLRLPLVLPALQLAGALLGTVIGSTGVGRDIPNALRILADLPEPTASAAFSRTLRAVVDWRGQVVTMLDRCYLTESVPVQLVWGEQDAMIPVSHAHMAHAAMPGSRLEIFPDSGHYPFHNHPGRFVDLVEEFIDTTPPARHDQEILRQLLRQGRIDSAITGPRDARILVLDALESDERSAT